MLKCIYLILSYNVYLFVSQSVEVESVAETSTTEPEEERKVTKLSKNMTTVGLADNNTTIQKEDHGEKELKRQDWDVWCKLQPNSHDCTGNGRFSTRYYYDALLEDCKTFAYGQCQHSYNNFITMTECHDSCRESGKHPLKSTTNYTDKVICRLQPSFGFGYEYHPSFYFDLNQKKCKGFSYSGMGGNRNRFPNSQICTVTCLKMMDPELTF